MTRREFEAWLTAYGRAWEAGDADAAVRLFSTRCRYYETPYGAPLTGRNAIHRYWTEGARDGQTGVHFSARVISFAQDTGYAHWQAEFQRVPSGRQVELDGILCAEFDASMRCAVFREWWHRHETTDGANT